jgi:hypothetical protein
VKTISTPTTGACWFWSTVAAALAIAVLGIFAVRIVPAWFFHAVT